MNRKSTSFTLALLTLLPVAQSPAAELSAAIPMPTLRSAATQVPLIELFTSEGCSSCPPADLWLSNFKKQSGLWRDFVPVAFHVDYWDSLGWQDRFAAPAFSARQQRYADAGNLRQVYTPGVLLQGAEWRAWGSSAALPAVQGPLVGPLQLQADAQGALETTWWPAKDTAAAVTINVVLLGFELGSAVRHGENAGRQLQHDFVVLGSSSAPMARSGDHYHAVLDLPTSHNRAQRYAVAAWVSRGHDPTPVQAVGGWWPNAPPAAVR